MIKLFSLKRKLNTSTPLYKSISRTIEKSLNLILLIVWIQKALQIGAQKSNFF